MTWIDVADTAVKVGLGAFLGLLGLILKAGHDRRSEQRKRRAALIEKLSAEFEEVHEVVVELFSTYATYLEAPNPIVKQMSWSDVRQVMVEKLQPAIKKLIGLEGRLMLIGSSNAVKKLNGYRLAATTLQNDVRMEGGSEGSLVTSEHWGNLAQTVVNRRTDFFESLRKEYEQA